MRTALMQQEQLHALEARIVSFDTDCVKHGLISFTRSFIEPCRETYVKDLVALGLSAKAAFVAFALFFREVNAITKPL